jgi:hypothetical protein
MKLLQRLFEPTIVRKENAEDHWSISVFHFHFCMHVFIFHFFSQSFMLIHSLLTLLDSESLS